MRAFFRWGVVPACGVVLLGLCAVSMRAQTRSTAQRRLDLSAFGLFSGTYTSLGSPSYLSPTGYPGPGGRNLTLSAGADLGFYSFHGARLGAEVRGGYPIKSGQVDGQKSILGGIRVTHEPSGYGFLGHVRPYGDLLAGRGEITYQNGGYPQPGILYLSNTSAVYAAGGGFELDVTRAFSVKADAQFQRWNTPVTLSGTLHTSQGGIGIVYRYGTGRGPR